MLERVTKKAYHNAQVTDLAGIKHDVKVLNTVASGVRVFLFDVSLVADIGTLLNESHIFQLSTGEWLTVTYKTPHFHFGKLIRWALDAVICIEKVTITRPTPLLSTQGGPRGFTDVVICTDIPCKIGLGMTYQEKKLDTDVEIFNLLISKQFELQKGDKVSFQSPFYKDAKIDGLFMVSQGLQEIRFDLDPRG